MKKMIPKPITEAQHQAAVILWSEQTDVRHLWPALKLLHHIPNGGSRNEIEGKQLKRQGVKPGVPDLCLPVARGDYHGLYIEMKREDRGDTSDEQEWWIKELSDQGYYAEVCHGCESAIRVLEWYMGLGDYRD